MTKIWDKTTHLSIQAYCILHKGTNRYRRVITAIKYGIPPVIALYYPFKGRIPKDWVSIYRSQLYWIALNIFTEHPNLIEDNTIDIDIYTYNYILPYLY